MAEDFLTFKRFPVEEDEEFLSQCLDAAIEKLQTLYPNKRIVSSDIYSICIESDSLYVENGIETYLLGFQDDEVPAIQRLSDGEVFTFRV